MCVIAGYSGKRRAAPLLIEMMKKIEYVDGGYATGIVTVHEGKLHYAKAIGDVEMLLRTTDAWELPGTTGVIHTRPVGQFISITHPYFDAHESLAMVENGGTGATGCQELYDVFNGVMNEMLERGLVSPSAYDLIPSEHRNFFTKDGRPYYYIDAYTFLLGERLKDVPADRLKQAMAQQVKQVHELFPADNVSVTVHKDLPDVLTVGAVTRPMSVLQAEGESFIASFATAFPEELQHLPVTHLPQCTVAQITPSGLEICSVGMEGVRTEPVDARIRKYYRDVIEEKLTGRKEQPLSLYEMGLPWDIWSAPRVDCRYQGNPALYLKPKMAAVYQVLWDFHREGRLHSRLGLVYGREIGHANRDCYYTKFWLD